MVEMIDFIKETLNKGKKVALVTVTEKEGGAPGSVGQMMAVTGEGEIRGTVGGGTAEYLLIQRAKEAIEKGEKVFSFQYNLKEKGMICGGEVKGFGNVLGSGKKVVLFGGGHIARSLYPLLKSVGFHTTIIEERPEYEAYFEGAEYLVVDFEELPSLELDHLFHSQTYIIICTRGHQLDYQALRFCMEQTYAYIGMIGSKNKVKATMERLLEEGISKEKTEQIYAPIGLKISDGTPNEIAISIVAEILKVKNEGSLSHMKQRDKK